MRTQSRFRKLIAATCLVVLLAGLSAQSASASLLGEYALQSSATDLVDTQLTDPAAEGAAVLPGFSGSTLVACRQCVTSQQYYFATAYADFSPADMAPGFSEFDPAN